MEVIMTFSMTVEEEMSTVLEALELPDVTMPVVVFADMPY